MPSRGQDRAARTHAALLRKIELQAGGDQELAKRLLAEHFRQLQARSARARRRRRAQRAAETAAELRRAGFSVVSEDELLALQSRQRRP
jgi:hypothetical protein